MLALHYMSLMLKAAIAIPVFLLVFFAGSFYLTSQQALFLALIAAMVTLWTNEGLPLGVVSLLPIIVFPMIGYGSVKEIAANYANPTIYLFLGGFFLAIAIEKSNLHHEISVRLLSVFPNTVRGLAYAMAVASAILSAVLSNTTVTLMLLPVALSLSDQPKVKMTLVLATAYGASIGGILTPIGTPPNLIFMGFLESIQEPAPDFIQWMLMTAPMVVVMLLVAPYMLSRPYRDVKPAEMVPVKSRFDLQQKKLTWILVALVVILVVNSRLSVKGFAYALDEKAVLLGFGLLMFLPGVNLLTWNDIKKVPFEILFLFGAGFSIAAVFMASGLSEVMAAKLSDLQGLPLFLLLGIVALMISLLTEVTSNTAIISLSLPVFYELAKNNPDHMISILAVATIAASYAFILPIATPPNAIAISSGYVKTKEMISAGAPINVVAVLVIAMVAYFFW